MEMFLTIKLCTYAKLTIFNRTDYLHKNDLALNNLQRLICHKPNKPNIRQICFVLSELISVARQ